jgi:hypothetical protein
MKTEKILRNRKNHLLHVLSIMVLLFLACTAPAKAQYCVGDSLALVEIYNATGGPSWTSSSGWLSGPLETWAGVTVENNRVTSLSLPFNNLSGTLPYHIGFLQELKVLELSGNTISGTLPVAFAFLQKLERLSLSQNNLSGSIPAVIGFMFSMKELNLSDNQLTGQIPSTLGLLSRLTYLNLSDNQFSGSLPSSLGYLSKLRSLSAYNNQLTGSIPSSIGNLVSAKDIFLYNNKLSGQIPSSVGELDSVMFFNVANNRLTGSVPASMANLKFIYFLNVEGNRIENLPNLSGVGSLFQLYVANNRLTFADIEPNIAKALGGNYAPQDSVGKNLTVSVCEGDSLVLSADVIEPSAANTFTWFNSDFSFISEPSSSPLLILPSVSLADAGVYSAEISNANVPDLFLYRKTIRVNVSSCPASSTAKSGSTSVYPVPFTQEATVEVSTASPEKLNITVLDMNGMAVESHKNLSTSNKTVIGQQLGKGTYYVHTVHGGKKDIVRVIKK